MDHLLRNLAPITEAGWGAIEDEARSRLVTQLAARKVVDFSGPRGWDHSATNLGRVGTIAGPVPGVTAAKRQVLTLVELRSEFQLSLAELADVERGSSCPDLSTLDEAARRMALAENVAVFHGYPDAGVTGITAASSHEPVEFEPDVNRYPNAVARATDVLRQAGISGPYGLAIGPDTYTAIVEATEHGGYLLFDHLRKILDGPLVWAPGIEGGVVVSLRGGDFVFDCGEDLVIGYAGHDGQQVTLYLEESFSFRVVEPDAAVTLRATGA